MQRGYSLIHRQTALGVMVSVFFVVSIVAYTDFPRRASEPPLTELERQGLAVWRRHNCQVCHQLYGFGGFLGPDLTNRVTDNTPDTTFRQLLVRGSGLMPALKLDASDQKALLAFLRAMNRTGRSQPRPLQAHRPVEPMDHHRQLIEAWSREGNRLPPEAQRGLDIWTRNPCGVCHRLFTTGLHRAPDLSARRVDRSPTALSAVFERGRGVMPAFVFTPEEINNLSLYLDWNRMGLWNGLIGAFTSLLPDVCCSAILLWSSTGICRPLATSNDRCIPQPSETPRYARERSSRHSAYDT